MGPASGQFDGSVPPFAEAGVSLIAIALEGAGKVGGNDRIKAVGPASGMPVVNHIACGHGGGPEVTLGSFARAGIEVADGGFVDLEVAVAPLLPGDLMVNELEEVGSHLHPAAEALARNVHPVTLPVDLLLAVERQVVDVFGGGDFGNQSRSGQAALLQARRQRCDHRRGKTGYPCARIWDALAAF
jgi:hypothetical protein